MELLRDCRQRPVDTAADGTPGGGVWLRLNVCALAADTARGHTGRGYGVFAVVRKGRSTWSYRTFLLCAVSSDAPDSFIDYEYREIGNDKRDRWTGAMASAYNCTKLLRWRLLFCHGCVVLLSLSASSYTTAVAPTTDVSPPGPEQATSAASRQISRAHNNPGTTARIREQ